MAVIKKEKKSLRFEITLFNSFEGALNALQTSKSFTFFIYIGGNSVRHVLRESARIPNDDVHIRAYIKDCDLYYDVPAINSL